MYNSLCTTRYKIYFHLENPFRETGDDHNFSDFQKSKNMASLRISSSFCICCKKTEKITARKTMQSGKKRREIAKIKGKIRLISKDNVLVAVVFEIFFQVWCKSFLGFRLRPIGCNSNDIFWRDEMFCFCSGLQTTRTEARPGTSWVICARARQAITGFWLNSCSHTLYSSRRFKRKRERENRCLELMDAGRKMKEKERAR